MNWKEEYINKFCTFEGENRMVFKNKITADESLNFIEQIISERDKEVIKMLENTDVQMSVNGSVSQDEIAMAKFIYKAHINHIKKKLKTYGK